MSEIYQDFAAGLKIADELAEQGFQPLREQWVNAVHADLMAAIEHRLSELPDGWRLAVAEGEVIRLDVGKWELRHRFVAIDPDCPLPLPFPAEPRRWIIYGPKPTDGGKNAL